MVADPGYIVDVHAKNTTGKSLQPAGMREKTQLIQRLSVTYIVEKPNPVRVSQCQDFAHLVRYGDIEIVETVLDAQADIGSSGIIEQLDQALFHCCQVWADLRERAFRQTGSSTPDIAVSRTAHFRTGCVTASRLSNLPEADHNAPQPYDCPIPGQDQYLV